MVHISKKIWLEKVLADIFSWFVHVKTISMRLKKILH